MTVLLTHCSKEREIFVLQNNIRNILVLSCSVLVITVIDPSHLYLCLLPIRGINFYLD